MSSVASEQVASRPSRSLRPDVSVLLVVRDEQPERLEAAREATAAQTGCGAVELLVAAPPEQLAPLAEWKPTGAITSVRLVPNPTGTRSVGLNRMLAVADAPIVARVDARSRPPVDYLARCVRRLSARPDLGVVGAIQRPIAQHGGVVARGIARALRNPWLLGGALYRRPGAGGSAETAYLGSYRRDALRALGGFDERLDANEDFDVAARVLRSGSGVWVEPGLEVGYEARATYRSLWKQYRAFGKAKVQYWRLTGRRPNVRQVIALTGFALGVVGLSVAASTRPSVAFILVVIGALGAAVTDHVADPSERDPRVRLAAGAASGVLIVGWVVGVVGAGVGSALGERYQKTRPPR